MTLPPVTKFVPAAIGARQWADAGRAAACRRNAGAPRLAAERRCDLADVRISGWCPAGTRRFGRLA